MGTRAFVLYDERGILHPDDAAVLEVFYESSDSAAIAQAREDWPEQGWALYRQGGEPHANVDPLAWRSLSPAMDFPEDPR